MASAFILALLLAAVADASRPEPPPAPPGQQGPASPPENPVPGGAKDSLALTQALDRALAEGWRDLHIETECMTEAGFRTVEVFASGVGISDRKTQFQLDRGEVRTLLLAFRETRFPDMRESYGGRRDPVVRENQPPRATCRVELRLDGLRKHVAQLQYGRQSEELQGLARRILETCAGPARSGRSAKSLEDGLAKLAAGELAAETLHVLVNRRVEPDDADAGRPSGWLLRVDGRQASTQRRRGEGGYAEPVALELSLEDLAALAGILRETGIADLPVNLYAEHYTELVVSVLDWRKAVQARAFAGKTRTTHGAAQKRFDQIVAKLQDLERRVGAEGRPASFGSRVPGPPGSR
jgi:hypothetical protein